MKISSRTLLIRFRLFQITINTAILVAVFCFALVFGKLIESIIVMFAYFLLRYKFDKTFHSANMWVCVTLSIMMCWAMIAVTLPISVSILSGIVVGVIDCYLLYKARDYVDVRNEILTIKKPKPFDVDTCTESELLERCAELKLSQENTELAVEFFIKKTRQKIIADRLCVSIKAVKTRKQRLKEKLNNKLQEL